MCLNWWFSFNDYPCIKKMINKPKWDLRTAEKHLPGVTRSNGNNCNSLARKDKPGVVYPEAAVYKYPATQPVLGVSRFGLAVRCQAGKQRDLGSNLLWLSFLFKICDLWTLSCAFVPLNETLKHLIAAHLNAEVILVMTVLRQVYNLPHPLPPNPLPRFSTSLISLMVSVDVKHHVYKCLAVVCNDQAWELTVVGDKGHQEMMVSVQHLPDDHEMTRWMRCHGVEHVVKHVWISVQPFHHVPAQHVIIPFMSETNTQVFHEHDRHMTTEDECGTTQVFKNMTGIHPQKMSVEFTQAHRTERNSCRHTGQKGIHVGTQDEKEFMQAHRTKRNSRRHKGQKRIHAGTQDKKEFSRSPIPQNPGDQFS